MQSKRLTLDEYVNEMFNISQQNGTVWESEQEARDYYIGQPEVWEGYWEDGMSPQDAVDSDMASWD